MGIIISSYFFDTDKNRFVLSESTNQECKDIPASFQICKNDNKEKINAEYMLYWWDLRNQSLKSGARVLQSGILYGDRWCPHEPKSFMILRYLGPNTIELHYFDGQCPKNKQERNDLLTSYFEKTGIAKPKFRARYRTWEQKRKSRRRL